MLLISIIPLQGCSFFYGDTPSLTYDEMFDSLWQDYNETYALFDVRGVDWDLQYKECKPLISEDMNDKEFFEQFNTGVQSAISNHIKSDNTIYTLSGQRINNTSQLKPGMYIINNKKVMIGNNSRQ